MFYRPADGHGLPHNPFNAIVAPRPIGWISTRDAEGRDNLAPYSFFNAVAYTPPQVMFANTGEKPGGAGPKDTIANIRATGIFAVNIVAADMAAAMNATAAHLAHGTDEFAQAGLARAACETIACARVAGAPATLECRLTRIVPLLGDRNAMVIGEVTGVHLRDDCVIDGRFDATAGGILARMGYRDYTVVREIFAMERPD